MPRVSVIVPTYNCARFLCKALRSAQNQTYADYEIIVVDDGSTDETREMVARCDKKVRYLYQSNKGVSAARNLGLSVATGELIAYLDADDMWYPHKLQEQIKFLEANEHCGLVHSDVDIINEGDQVIHRGFNQKTGRSVPQGRCTRELLQECHIQTPSVLVRREYVTKVGNFDERLKGTEDYLQWILVAMEGAALGYIDESLAMYRWTKGSISCSSRWMCEDLVKMLNILLREKYIGRRCGPDAVEIVRARIHTLGNELAYLERIEGQLPQARRRLLGLIIERPSQVNLYIDLFKACLPASLMMKLRMLKGEYIES